MQAVAAGADREGGAHGGLGFVAARFLDHHIGQQGELGAAKQVLCVGDGRMVVILVVPLGGNLQDGIPGVIGQGRGVSSQRQAAVVSNTLLKKPDSEPTALPLTASQLITGAWVPVAVTV